MGERNVYLNLWNNNPTQSYEWRTEVGFASVDGKDGTKYCKSLLGEPLPLTEKPSVNCFSHISKGQGFYTAYPLYYSPTLV